jgi:CHASE3 domain sensor protein
MTNGSSVRATTDVDLPLPPSTFAGLVIAIVTIAVIALATYRTLDDREIAVERVTRTLTFLQQLEGVGSTLKDAETGQRGYLLTGEERYVEPYSAANTSIPSLLSTLREQASDDSERASIDALAGLIQQKLQELGETIALKRAGDSAGALQIVRTDRGKAVMDRIRTLIADLESRARTELTTRQNEFQRAVTLSTWSVFGGLGALTILLSLAAHVMSRDFSARETEAWLRGGQMGLSLRLQGEQRRALHADPRLQPRTPLRRGNADDSRVAAAVSAQSPAVARGRPHGAPCGTSGRGPGGARRRAAAIRAGHSTEGVG